MPTVLGIFDTRKHAEDTVLSLVEAGFERYDVRIVDDVSGLIEQGVAEEEAHAYAGGIGRGGIVVAVRCFPEGVERAAGVMRRLGAVDVSTCSALSPRRPERVRPFGEMLEGSMRPMRAGETEKERRSVPEHDLDPSERLGDMDCVYGGGIGQKGDENLRDAHEKRSKSQDKV